MEKDKLPGLNRRTFLKTAGTASLLLPAFSIPNIIGRNYAYAAPMLPERLPKLPTSVITSSRNAKYTYHDWSNSAHVVWFGGTVNPVVMALTAFTNDTSCDDKLVGQLNEWSVGTKSPVACGGYSAQHEVGFLASYLIANSIPRISRRLASTTHNRYKLIAKAELISNCFITSNKNPYVLNKQSERTVRGDTNVGRNWAPNYQMGLQGAPILSSYILGGPTTARNFLNSVKIADFVKELNSAGLTNTAQTFGSKRLAGAPSFSQIETALRDWSFTAQRSHGGQTYSFSTMIPLTINRMQGVFNRPVTTGLNSGRGISGRARMIKGQSRIKNLGAMGMLTELDSEDANGLRSSMSYSFKGMRGALMILSALMATGNLERTAAGMTDLKQRIAVGMADFKIKSEEGYYSYAKGGKGSNNENWVLSDSKINRDYNVSAVFSLWENLLMELM